MPRRGRNFETLVETIESAFEGQDVVVASPDIVVGRQSGSPREIDVSLRGKLGSAELFVILECRERKGTQGVRWIEQIASKRDDVGAQLAIAVSTSKFSKAAQQLAKSRQVLLRRLTQVTDIELRDLFGVEEVTLFARRFETTDLYAVQDADIGPLSLLASSSKVISTTVPMFGFGDNEPSLSVRDLEAQAKDSLALYDGLEAALPEQLPQLGTELTVLNRAGIVHCVLSSRRGSPYCQMASGERAPVSAVKLKFRSWVQVGRLSVERWRKYLDADVTIAYAGSGAVNFGQPQRADFVLDDSRSETAVLRVYESRSN